MSFNAPLVSNALYAAFGTKNVGDTLSFPATDPVFSNGATAANRPSVNDISGIPTVTFEMRSRFLYMKYAFTTETLALAGIADDTVFQNKIKQYFQSEFQTYILSLVPQGTVYKAPASSDVTFEFNIISAGTIKVAVAYTNIKYWFQLP